MKTYDSIIRGRLVTPDGILDQGWLAIANSRSRMVS